MSVKGGGSLSANRVADEMYGIFWNFSFQKLISIHEETSPGPGDKLQMGYKSIMRTDKWVSELVS